MAEKFTGFANAPVKKGKRVDFRDVDPFVDESDEGKVRDASQKTPSTIVTGRPQAEPDEADADTETAQAAGGKEASGS